MTVTSSIDLSTITTETTRGPEEQEDGEQQIVFIKKKKKKNSNNATLRSKDEVSKDRVKEEEVEARRTVEEMIALRRLKQARVGIELQRLNAGEPKKKKKKKNPNAAGEGADGSEQGGKPVGANTDPLDDDPVKDDRLADDEPEDEDARTRKIIKSNHFTQQTNTLDVDKHMMAYIEEELQRRRTDAIAAGTIESSEPILKGLEAIASLDPRDELYKIAEKYRIQKKPVVEGNVTLSATMLTSIPEVDLGIDNRIRNFEATEKAKRQLTEQRAQQNQAKTTTGFGATQGGPSSGAEPKEHFAADRFLLPNHLKQNPLNELDSLKIARLESEGLFEEADVLRKDLKRKAYQLKYGNNNNSSTNASTNNHRFGSNHHGPRSNQLATDDRAVENFRKRMGGRR
ncbi:uncharacterized protein PGTG_10545 [Puccinia graminis f. sp. tritici CRL 75-36-700-3]|uniref:Hepatocellular carcinoma-associated antigen 59 n=1 Tax=Puccinia graminis f. sp. tritici (strain CRL 75-36-700-3 / race SCCL) TaxID=418459 RepID=E3KIP2_PUCGT|nr:uncharacterized protein PGTG_10545 [Puccinia graminis f. sp. tritici CRL 75-36-700-3]EFP84167.2 hypothetical protein PGTG_10545 [Puccinia graminis f. sp. tritici CRL 75-36-700-3]